MFQSNVVCIISIKIRQNHTRYFTYFKCITPQNRHFDQSSSFGMISGCLRNDIGIFITRKNEFYTNAFFMNFHAPASALTGRVFKIHDFFGMIL